jgi:molybdopterin-containing oxidoreductase family iron-sulfur binding subunit
VRELIDREFAEALPADADPITRRRFAQLMGAAFGLAGLAGCSQPPREKILPYVRQPEGMVQGKPLFFATTMTLGGFGVGLLAKSLMGRPLKLDGNPDHPASRGATDAVAQAGILGLYDPDRSRLTTFRGRATTWENTLVALRAVLKPLGKKKGEGLRILTGTVTSPTLAKQFEAVRKRFPESRWHQYDPVNRDAILEGTKLAFGEYANPVYHLDQTDVILSLDADFLGHGPAKLAMARAFADRRRPSALKDKERPTRLYVTESTLSITGANADHRLPISASRVEALARALARKLGKGFEKIDASSKLSATEERWVSAVAKDLTAEGRKRRTVIIPGDFASPAVHALAHAMNLTLGNVGKTVTYTDPVEAAPRNQTASLRELADDMQAGRVKVLLVLGANPVYDAPADLGFASRLNRVPFRLHQGLYQDETARLCHWHVPETHFLESWGDVRAFDGTASVVQPLIAPLAADARSAYDLLDVLTGEPGRPAYDHVRDTWREVLKARDKNAPFERFWESALHDGKFEKTAFAAKEVKLTDKWADGVGKEAVPGDGLELVFRPDPALHDGRFANNSWLQELPRPITRLTWDNAALISPAAAEKLGLPNGKSGFEPDLHAPRTSLLRLNLPDREKVEIAAWIIPGLPDDSVTIHLGYGRSHAGVVGNNVGVNAYRLRDSKNLWSAPGLTLERTGKETQLACVQHHHLMENRDLVRSASYEEYHKNRHFTARGEHGEKRVPLSLYEAHEYPGYRWGMTIDLSACTGCGACVVACQAENNIPVVGKEEVLRGREMHWIRIDRYFAGSGSSPDVLFQPVLCMHCEDAPCEVVCPVGATVHSDDGLNDMVYNRCVGTRYCSNNCPYKVRRFNFFHYSEQRDPLLKLPQNPDVSVRARGVMEKCSYCVQRIRGATKDAEREGRRVFDGEILTACQAACPSQAIVFGNTNDRNSQVSRLKKLPINYGILEDLNTKPQTTYLGQVRNPNPELES